MRLLMEDMENAERGTQGKAWPPDGALSKVAQQGIANLACKLDSVYITPWDRHYFGYETSNIGSNSPGQELKDLRPAFQDPRVVVTHSPYQNPNRRTAWQRCADTTGSALTEVMVFDTALGEGPWAVAEGLFRALVEMSGMRYSELLLELYGFLPYYNWHYNDNFTLDPKTGLSAMDRYFNKYQRGVWPPDLKAAWEERKAGIERPGYFNLQPVGPPPWRWHGQDCDAVRDFVVPYLVPDWPIKKQ